METSTLTLKEQAVRGLLEHLKGGTSCWIRTLDIFTTIQNGVQVQLVNLRDARPYLVLTPHVAFAPLNLGPGANELEMVISSQESAELAGLLRRLNANLLESRPGPTPPTEPEGGLSAANERQLLEQLVG